MKNHYDVLIIGGGVIGHSVAYSLSKRGLTTLVIDKGEINQKASSAAAGMLAVQAEVTENGPLFELARKSRNMFPTLQKELMENSRIDIELIEEGMLNIALTEEKARFLKETIKFQKSIGEEASWLTCEEVKMIEPGLTGPILGAMFAPNDGQVSAYKLATAFAKGAEAFGAETMEHTEVTGLMIENDKVIGVKTVKEHYYAKHVVVAGGAWTKEILETIGFSLPISPVKGECFSVKTNERLLTKTLFSEDCYIVPKASGRYIIGATMVPNTFDEKVSVEGIAQLLNKATKLLPALKHAEWEKVWAGIRPETQDGLPYLGEHPSIEGLYVAGGHYRNGILLSPITGEIMATIIQGLELPQNLSVFSLDPKKRGIKHREATY
jgi:glycine oxidase